MTDDTAILFDRAFLRRMAGLSLEPEAVEHLSFLSELFLACSPMRDVLPRAMLLHQAAIQQASHQAAHPNAMRRIFFSGSTPIARFVIDWACPDAIRGIDIAVLPDFRSTGIGLAIMRAWCEIADRRQRPSALSVLRDNPAARLYRRLGFVAVGDDGHNPVVEMTRAPRG